MRYIESSSRLLFQVVSSVEQETVSKNCAKQSRSRYKSNECSIDRSQSRLIGKDFVDITEAKLNVDEICDIVSSPSCGAVSVFVGTTRNNFEGKGVLRLEYEAYMPMAQRKMLEVCASIRERWEVNSIAIIHRIGVVPVKEASIVIAISSAHRQASLEAVHYAIDTVKAVVPVWKKEIYSDETSSWKQNKECAWAETGPPCIIKSVHSIQPIKDEPLAERSNDKKNVYSEML